MGFIVENIMDDGIVSESYVTETESDAKKMRDEMEAADMFPTGRWSYRAIN